MQMDSTKLILTDDHFTSATPRCWETYARIRWSVPLAARSHVVVLGGFIGATEDGRTTTLGRGGSDLTASLVGAAVNAEEVQLWKDVDGMLTWDPKIRRGGYRLKSLSYQEAGELAQAGATILHPETIAPAQRLRIPLVIRNTFHPHGEGTRVGVTEAACSNPVKSIACKTNITVVELRSPSASEGLAEYSPVVERACKGQKAVTVLAVSDEVIYLALESNGRDPGLQFAPDRCLEVRVRTGQAIITLIGQGLKRCNVVVRLSSFLKQHPALVLPQHGESCSVRLVVPEDELATWINMLEAAFFAEVDANVFASSDPVPEEQQIQRSPRTSVAREQQMFPVQAKRFVFPGLRR
jgi:aspartate kinase